MVKSKLYEVTCVKPKKNPNKNWGIPQPQLTCFDASIIGCIFI